jgi:hypothetical protein
LAQKGLYGYFVRLQGVAGKWAGSRNRALEMLRFSNLNEKDSMTCLMENWAGGRLWLVIRGGQYQDWMTLIPASEFFGDVYYLINGSCHVD